MSILIMVIAAGVLAADLETEIGDASRHVVQLDAKSNSKAAQARERAEQKPFSLAFVPHDAVVVAAVRPAELLKRPVLAALRKELSEQADINRMFGIAVERIDSLAIVVIPDESVRISQGRVPAVAGLIMQLADAADAAELLKSLLPDARSEFNGVRYFCGPSGKPPFCFIHQERTVVISNSEQHLMRLIDAGIAGASSADWAKDWKEVNQADGALLVNMLLIHEMLDRELSAWRLQTPSLLIGFSPLWRSTRGGTIALTMGDDFTVHGRLSLYSPEDKQRVANTLLAALTLCKNSLSWVREWRERLLGADRAVMHELIAVVEVLLDSVEITRAHDQVRLEASLNADSRAKLVVAAVPAALLPLKVQSQHNLKELILATHQYLDAHNSFPPAVLYGRDGKTPYSWRVALLPFLGHDELHKEYNFDEPWDGPNNKQVLAKMPAVFRDPAEGADSTDACYFGLTGESTIFSGNEGTPIKLVRDGVSRTLMFVEAKRRIPWTKPEDILYVDDEPLPKFGGCYRDGFHAAFGDGSVRFIPHRVDQKALRAAITKAGGEREIEIGN